MILQRSSEIHVSTTPTAIRLKGERHTYDSHTNKQGRAHIDGRRGAGVGRGADDGRDDAHDAVAGDGDAVAGGAVGAGQDLGRVGVQGAVVDVEAEADGAAEADVLGRGRDGRVGEEEGHGHHGPDHHRVLAPQRPLVAHPARQHGPEDARDVGQGVVAPGVIGADAFGRAAAG